MDVISLTLADIDPLDLNHKTPKVDGNMCWPFRIRTSYQY